MEELFQNTSTISLLQAQVKSSEGIRNAQHTDTSFQNNIPYPKYTTKIQIHHFKTTFVCPRSIASVLFDSVRRFRASLLLHITFSRSWCTWRDSCVAAKQQKQKTKRIKLQSIHTVTGKGGIGGADQWVLVKAKGIPKGYHRELNHARILEYPLSVFNKHSTLTNTPAWNSHAVAISRHVTKDLINSILTHSAFRLHKHTTILTNMIGSMRQLRECRSIRARNFTVTLLLRTTRMRSQLLGRVRQILTELYGNQISNDLDEFPPWCPHVQFLGFLAGAPSLPPTTNFDIPRSRYRVLTFLRATKNSVVICRAGLLYELGKPFRSILFVSTDSQNAPSGTSIKIEGLHFRHVLSMRKVS